MLGLLTGSRILQPLLRSFQSFSVAEQFTGMAGQYVPLKETIRGFKMLLDGECDDIPESAFLFAGTIDDVFAKAGKK